MRNLATNFITVSLIYIILYYPVYAVHTLYWSYKIGIMSYSPISILAAID